MKNKVIEDLKQLWYDFKYVYPVSFNRIFANWQVSLVLFFVIISCFYLDNAVTDFVLSLKNSTLDTIFAFGRWYGSGNPTWMFLVVLYVAGFAFNYDRMRDTGLLIGETFVFAGFITLILKSTFGRWRPFTNHGDLAFYGFTWSDNDHLSFTSGHANVAFALSTVLASSTDNIYLKIFFYIPAVITALSRIYHDQHWLSDVVVAAFVAVLVSRVLISFHKQSKSASSN